MATNQQFGYSLKLDDGDIVLETAPDTGLLVLDEVSGTDNLMQALLLRVQTTFGSDRFNTTYGLDVTNAFTQPGTVSAVKSLIKLSLVRTLGTDPRVSDIQDVQFVDEPAYRARHPEVTDQDIRDQRHRRTWAVDVLLQAANGQNQVLSANVGV
jgi:hypothetical protein